MQQNEVNPSQGYRKILKSLKFGLLNLHVHVPVQLCSNYLALCLMLRSHNKSQIGLVTVVGRRIDGGWQLNIMKVIVLTKTDTFSGKC